MIFLRHTIRKNGSSETIHTLPICGDLLDTPHAFLTPWKDEPLSDVEINFLQVESQEQEVEQWMLRKDSTIYSKLNDLEIKELQALLEPLIRLPIFSLSYQRQSNPSTTIKEIQNSFALLLATNTLSEEFETKRISTKFGRSYLFLIQRQIFPQKFEIAKSLFPRLTYEQYSAYSQRMQACKDFLTNYSSLKTKSIGIEEFKNIIKSSSTPLTTVQRNTLNTKLKRYCTVYEHNPKTFKRLVVKLVEDITPSYFTMLKVMYPELSDIEALLSQVYSPNEAISRLGKIEYPLEQDLKIARNITFQPGSPEHDFAKILLKKLKKNKFPFHGAWILNQ